MINLSQKSPRTEYDTLSNWLVRMPPRSVKLRVAHRAKDEQPKGAGDSDLLIVRYRTLQYIVIFFPRLPARSMLPLRLQCRLSGEPHLNEALRIAGRP